MANPEDLEELSIYRDPDTGRFIGYDPQSSVSYAIPVDKLEGQEVTAGFAGEQHDVPQVRELTVADFESGTLDTDVWGGDVGNFTVQSTTKKDGSYALKANSENNIHSFDGLDAYPQRGDTFETSVYITAQDQQAWITWFLQNNSFNSSVDPNNATAIKLNTNSNIRLFHRRDGTRIISEFGVDSNNYLDEWLTFRVELLENGDTKATVFDSTDTELGTASISPDNPYDSGGISFSTFETTPAYWDTWTLKRRSPEYFTDTQKGTTELGNEVTPSGAVHTGPQEVSPGHPNYPRANLPVPQDESDFSDIAYYDSVAETPVFGPKGKAGPSSSARHQFAKAYEALAVDENATYIRDDFEDGSFQSGRTDAEKLIAPEVASQEPGWSFLKGMYRPEWTVENGSWSIRNTANSSNDDGTVLLGETGQLNTLSLPSAKVNGQWIIRWGNTVNSSEPFYWYLIWEDSNNWIRAEWNHSTRSGFDIVKSDAGTVSNIISSDDAKGDFLRTQEFIRKPDGTWEFYQGIGTEGVIPSEVTDPQKTATDTFLPTANQTRLEHGGSNEMEIDWLEVR